MTSAMSPVAAPKHEGWLARHLVGSHAKWGHDPSAYDPQAIEETLPWLSIFFGRRRWFRLDVQGWERVPESPALLVSNHSGGTTVLDAWGLLFSWYRRFGSGRPVHVLSHEMVLSVGPTGRFFGRRGVLHASPATALSVLRDHRRDLLVMPGGDLDTWRPFRDRYKVRFAGRTGYARLALKAQVPIVPVANAGPHATLVVLSDGMAIAKALHIPKLARANIWPLHLALPWGLALGPLPHLPPPKLLRYRFGEPIYPPKIPPGEPPEDAVQALDEKTRAAVQGLLDDLAIST